MASLNSIIEIQQELRPCFVNNKKALFHKWVHNMAIVEYEDGHIDEVAPKEITFIDGKINEYAFRE